MVGGNGHRVLKSAWRGWTCANVPLHAIAGPACRVSGFDAARRLGVARGLWFDLPGTYWLLSPGRSASMAPRSW